MEKRKVYVCPKCGATMHGFKEDKCRNENCDRSDKPKFQLVQHKRPTITTQGSLF